MSSNTSTKIAFGIAGTTGVSSLGVSALLAVRVMSAHVVPAGAWAALVVLGTAAALVISLRLILDYRLRKLEVDVWSQGARSAAELDKTRLEIHQALVEKASSGPGDAQSYRELILADALYVFVQQNGTQLPGVSA